MKKAKRGERHFSSNEVSQALGNAAAIWLILLAQSEFAAGDRVLGEPPLHAAARLGFADVCRALVARGAVDPGALDAGVLLREAND